MRAKTASIFHREGDEDVGTSVDPNDRLRLDAVRQKLPVFNLFGSVAMDGGCVREDRITVYGIYNYINN